MHSRARTLELLTRVAHVTQKRIVCYNAPRRASTSLSPQHQAASSRNIPNPSRPRRAVVHDETTLAGARHKPSLSMSGPSLGYLISELTPTTPAMLRDGTRVPGEMMEEEHRTMARRVVLGFMAVPVGVGLLGVLWWWVMDRNDDGVNQHA